MLAELDDYDWQEAFGYAGEPDTCAIRDQGGIKIVPCLPDAVLDLTPFAREDVAEIAAKSEGENDADDWLIYGRLKDGRWFYLEAGCDYTGWDCRANGRAVIARDRAECERFALTDHARQRLGVVLG